MPNLPDSGAPNLSSPGATHAVPDLTVLEELAGRPLEDHAALYERLHAQLQSALNEIDNA